MTLVAISPTPDAEESLVDLLQNGLVCALDLASQAKQAHWNVKGASFIALHELFDKAHAEFTDAADMMAERIAALGGQANGTCDIVASSSKLQRYPEGITNQQDHIKALTTAMIDFSVLIKRAAHQAESLEDAATGDLFIEILRNTDKMRWFVQAHMSEA